MSDVITPNLGLTLPTVLVSPGPTYANEINADLALIDSTVFSPNNKVPTSGLNINADLPINQNNINNARSYRFFNNGAELTGPSDISSVYEFGGDLYWINASGVSVQITHGAGLNPASPDFIKFNISSNYTVLSSVTYNYFDVTTVSGALSITLPAVSSLAAGRFYYIKDVGGSAQANNITLIRDGSDTFDSAAGNLVLSTSLGGWLIVGNGISNWDVFYMTTKLMMNGRFGTDIQAVLVQGNSVAVKATSTNNVLIGGTSNTVTVGGASSTLNSSSSVSILSPSILIGQSASGITLGTGGTGSVTINSGTTICNFDVHINGALTLNSTSEVNGDMTVNGTLIVNNNSTIGSSGTDTCVIYATTTTSNACTFNGVNQFFGSVETFGTTTIDNLIFANATGNIVTATNGRFTGRRTYRNINAAYANNTTDYTPLGSGGYDYVWILASAFTGSSFSWQIPAAPGGTAYINGDMIKFAVVGSAYGGPGVITIKDPGGATIGTLSSGGGSPTYVVVPAFYNGTSWINATGL